MQEEALHSKPEVEVAKDQLFSVYSYKTGSKLGIIVQMII